MRTLIIALSFVLFYACEPSMAQENLPQNLSPNTSWLSSADEYRLVQAQGRSQISFEMENDSLLLKRDDGFYTSGNHLLFSNTLRQANRAITYTWRLGQDLYTASDIKLKPAQLSRIDHPYAGWIFVGASRQIQNNDGSGFRFGVDVGCLGPCAGGEWTQKNLHRILKQALPQAWSTQLKQEWGVVMSGEHSQARWHFNSEMDLGTRVRFRLGNIFTDASADLTWRYGRLNQIHQDPASFFYARAEAKAVAYNATVQGGLFRKQDLPVHVRHVVPEIELGYYYKLENWGVSASVIRRASEIRELGQTQGAQNFAKIQIDYSL